MGIRMLRGVAGRLIIAGGALLSLPAQSDMYATPALTVAEVYDDNLLFSPTAPQEDRILRLSPAIDAGYRSAPMTLHGRYTFDAERYARHPDLDDNQVREHATLDWRYEAARTLTLSADASYTETQTPGELAPETGLEFGRARAERFFFSPSLVYQFDRLTAGTTSYSFTRDELAGGIGSDTHVAAFGLDRRIAPRDTASFGYRYEEFRFDVGDPVTAHVLLAGGTREFTPRTAATVLAGPRFSNDSTDPEISASLFHKLDQGELDLAYTRSETTVIGRTGTATTETLGATLVYWLGSSIEIRAAPSFLSSTLDSLQADVFIMNLEAGYRIARNLTLIGSYEFSSQRGSLTAPGGGKITRNVALLGLAIAAPERTDSATRPRVLTPSTLGGEPRPTPTELKLEEER